MKLSNDVEKYEIEVAKMGQKYSFFSYSDDGMHACMHKSARLPMYYVCSSLCKQNFLLTSCMAAVYWSTYSCSYQQV